MGMFSRFTEIINANINSMLEKAEDPEKMIKLMIFEMEDTLTEAKSAAAEVVADKLRVSRVVKSERGRRNEWEDRAELALSKGREELAREAIEQKMDCERKLESAETRLEEIEGLVTQYQSDISRLEEKLQNARTRQRALIASHNSAATRKRLEEKIYRLNTSGAFAKFEQYENRIDRWRAEAEVMRHSNNSLESKFRKLEHGKDVDSELQKLKDRINGKIEAKKEEEPQLAEVAG